MEKQVQVIEKSLIDMLPWWVMESKGDQQILACTEKLPTNYLKRFYLFLLTELNLSNNIKDIPKFINERYLNVLSASYRAGLTVLTAICGYKGKVEVYVGFLSDSDDDKDPKIFQKIVEGVLPGVKTQYNQELGLDYLLKEKKFAGLVSGVPTLKIDEEKQRFNIATAVRSMYGENYTLLIISKPLIQSEVARRFEKLMEIRDQCHSIALQTKNREEGQGVTDGSQSSETHTVGSSESKVKSRNILRVVLSTVKGGETGTSSGNTTSDSETTGISRSIEEHFSEGISYEEQNGLALELETIADNFIDRLKKGLNVGYWETTVTFATATQVGRDILGGSLLGELAKPSKDNFPAKLNFALLDKDRIALIPKCDSPSEIFPKSLCSYVTSEELSLLASPPIETLPGYEIKRMPPLSLTDTAVYTNDKNLCLGKIVDYGKPLESSSYALSHRDLVKHIFVAGTTGSGKTTTVKQILKESQVPFLVLESAKRDYRKLHGDNTFNESLRIYTIGDATVSPLSLNPFYILPGVLPLSHIDLLKALFNASFSLYGPMPHILEKCLHNVYINKGWNLTKGLHPALVTDKMEIEEERYKDPEHFYCFPTLADLRSEVDSYVKNKLEYKGELSDNIRTAIITRIESLGVGAKGLMFNTNAMIDLEELLNNPTIFEMETLSDDDDKAFFVGLMLIFINEYRQIKNSTIQQSRKSKTLQHLLVVEEAHRLLKNVETEKHSEMMGNPKGKAVETFCNVISEMRSLGQGVIVVEQIPTKIAPDVVKNTNTKIVHRLVSKDDQSLLAGSLSISNDDALYLSRLKTGYALCHKEGMERPVELEVNTNVEDVQIIDDRIKKVMAKHDRQHSTIDWVELNELREVAGAHGEAITLQFLNSLLTSEDSNLKSLLEKCIDLIDQVNLEQNYRIRFDRDKIKCYLIENIIMNFIQGVYCKNQKYPIGLAETLKRLVSDERYIEIKKLKGLIADYWGAGDTAQVIYEIVSKLILNVILSKKWDDFNNHTLSKMIDKYFLLPDESAKREIISRVKNSLGRD